MKKGTIRNGGSECLIFGRFERGWGGNFSLGGGVSDTGRQHRPTDAVLSASVGSGEDVVIALIFLSPVPPLAFEAVPGTALAIAVGDVAGLKAAYNCIRRVSVAKPSGVKLGALAFLKFLVIFAALPDEVLGHSGDSLGWGFGRGFCFCFGVEIAFIFVCFSCFWAEVAGMAAFEKPAKHWAVFFADQPDSHVEEFDFGGGLNGAEFGMSLEVFFVGVEGDAFGLEGEANGDALGHEF